ncbi:hypothetical protein [uncultured Campylobacter sp.]|uniref:hypothetical protein n=1 Tax=uncultured Campylobacter sp. TaxID=218934 RepID=UPI003211CA0F
MIQGRIHTKSQDYKKAAEILSPMREDGNQDACALYGKVLKGNNNKTLQVGMQQRLGAQLRTLGRLLRNTIETGVFLCEQSL